MMLKGKTLFNAALTSALILFTVSCNNEDKTNPDHLFTLLSSGRTGINFSNDLQFDQKFNIYTYRNYYNGGGVALGDINNDGLLDVYFNSNLKDNKLYLNKGNFQFEDISETAGVSGTHAWSTGVAMADVNGDGWLDIYVCNSGDIAGDKKQNELFINNGNLTFTDKAKEYGVDDEGFTTHAVFFDYDRDQDLDLYILNNSYQAIGSFNLRKNEREKRDKKGGDKLLRNDNGKFVDVSEQAGIYGSVIGFGLGVTVSDVNKDGWPDLYVSNDFFERDYLYINNQDGTFKEKLTEQMQSISGASMGADMADINNDTWPDLFVTEMLPSENSRLKTVTTFEDWNRYQYNVANDYFHQFTRNMLQLNMGNGTFSEVGRLSGVQATDWSWGALIFDMNNDGIRDLFVANGIFQDLTNQDFLQYASNEEFVKSVIEKKSVDYKKLTEIIPSNPVPNFAFENRGDLQFVNKATEWGLDQPGFSNGSAYGDLDNDGDLDLIVNNVNMKSFVYRNETDKKNPGNRFLKFILKGTGKNTQAVGATITITGHDTTWYGEQQPTRGFESSVDPRPNFGLGKTKVVQKIRVDWPDGRYTEIDSIETNQIITLEQEKGLQNNPDFKPATFSTWLEPAEQKIDFIHQENLFVDFDRDKLIYQMLSTEGPGVCGGDINGDGLEDFYIGGAKGQSGSVFLQNTKGGFQKLISNDFETDGDSEDTKSLFFDADGDGDQDLYVCSGGNDFSSESSALADRLYLNNGKGGFTKSQQILPAGLYESTSTVKAADFDRDGDLDLFVGVRLKPFAYGIPMNGYILRNDGKGNFENVSDQVAPELKGIGMITDATWEDVDGDQDSDLLVVGEYMPIVIFINTNGTFSNQTSNLGLNETKGWWTKIQSMDADGDGDMDFILGNHGLNSRFKADDRHPLELFVSDFDRNGTIEHILCAYNGDQSYPFALRHDLIAQMPYLKKSFLKYDDYKNATIKDIFTEDQLKEALRLEARIMTTSVLINEGKMNWRLKPLPVEAQFSPIYAIATDDFDQDGITDILLGGNLYGVKPETGRYDASHGLILKGNGKGDFIAISPLQSGINIDGEVRDFSILKGKGGNKYLLVARNNMQALLYQFNLNRKP